MLLRQVLVSYAATVPSTGISSVFVEPTLSSRSGESFFSSHLSACLFSLYFTLLTLLSFLSANKHRLSTLAPLMAKSFLWRRE